MCIQTREKPTRTKITGKEDESTKILKAEKQMDDWSLMAGQRKLKPLWRWAKPRGRCVGVLVSGEAQAPGASERRKVWLKTKELVKNVGDE